MYLSATQIDSQYLSSSISSSSETIEEMSPNKRQRFQETILALNDNSQLFPTLQPKITNQPVKNNNTASFYGLPLKVKDLLKDLRNISQLYEWQSELMEKMLDRYERVKRSILKNVNPVPVDDPLNLLYLSPTSGGKTLVAELLMLYTLLIRKLDCIFVMPFVSIVQEKVKMLEEFGEHLNFYIEEYAGVKGMIPPIKRQLMKNKRTLYICTIEKANSLINSLIETDRLDKEIGLVVADELHMIGDGPRGFIYESLLTKIKYSSKQMLTKSNCFPIQIVATTATLENKRELADFLDAILYERNFRPVELREFIKLDRDIYELNKAKLSSGYDEAENCIERFRELDLSRETAQQKKDDPDNLVSLVAECIPNESCLVFCPTKKNCENVASLLVKYLPSELKQHKRDMKLKLFHELKEENSNNVCPVLRQSIQFGIAYHHSGLTSEERQLIEQAFREGTLCLLTCTSTLAAGVNLPAKRVIIRSPYVGFDFISGNQYRQMIGRAGRAGLIDSTGESILVFKSQDRQKVLSLITGSMKRCESSFECNSSLAFSIFVLSLIALNLTHLGSQILFFFKQTLFYLQYRNKIGANKTESNQEFIPEEFEFISNALVYLIKNGFIKSSGAVSNESENTRSLFYSEFEVTQLGKAAIRGNIDLECVNQLYTDLKFGLKSLVLSNYLHLIYLCTPYELVNGLTNFDLDIYLRKFGNLNEEEVKCANFIGIQEEYIRKKRMNQVTAKKVNEAVFKRFYLTLVIYELWKTNNEIWTVANEFQMDRGFVQTIVQSAASFSSGVLHFCEQIDEFWPYNNLLKEFIKRLQYNCSSVDLIVLLELDSVKLTRAKQLFEAGYKTLESIASAKDEDLSAKVRNLQIPIARRIIKSAKKILKEKAEILQEEAENLLLQIKI